MSVCPVLRGRVMLGSDLEGNTIACAIALLRQAAELQIKAIAMLEGKATVPNTPIYELPPLTTLEKLEDVCRQEGIDMGNGRLADGRVSEKIAARFLNRKLNTLARQASGEYPRIPFRPVSGKRYYRLEDIARELDNYGNHGNSGIPVMEKFSESYKMTSE